MADNVVLRNMIYGGKKIGVDTFESMIESLFQVMSTRRAVTHE
jgi:hypothetical protein